MKLVLINTFKSGGGAAIACQRLIEAVNIYHKEIQTTFVYQKNETLFEKIRNLSLLVFEKSILYFNLINKKDVFKFSTAQFGSKISNLKKIKDADVIHIHWTNNAFITLAELENIIALKKPIIMTMHDMWVFTGGCHYSRGCDEFKNSCQNCIYLKNHHLSVSQHLFKAKIFENKNISFVGCSNWISDIASESSIGKDKQISCIPNPIDTETFKIVSAKENIEDSSKTSILFISANLTDPRKGLDLLMTALENQKNKNIHLILVGKSKNNIHLPPNVTFEMLGFINSPSELIKLYNKVDFFICPSSEDNLPNTIMESIACGTPVIAFDIGGISDLIQHKENGYLISHNGNLTENLSSALDWAIENKANFEKNRENVSRNAHEKYSYLNISNQYAALYKKVITNK
jgi:glycosyltransferase involved in cell wall biosynthesis